ncbi:MAG: hypothetical protein A2039_09065 [Candidatus Melainabacteria bacterium GWA2_34_9]|nr:MAG: hypothetical protein A2039_09065 [Candidatus Melainabacteria bacterium GWA2_34_9]
MSLSINRMSIPQNNLKQVAFGRMPGGEREISIEERVAKLEEKSKLQRDFNHAIVDSFEGYDFPYKDADIAAFKAGRIAATLSALDKRA